MSEYMKMLASSLSMITPKEESSLGDLNGMEELTLLHRSVYTILFQKGVLFIISLVLVMGVCFFVSS